LKLNGVAFPPGEISPKLKRHQVGKEIMIEEAAQPAGMVTTDLKVFSQGRMCDGTILADCEYQVMSLNH
jgi:hypothetical protein